MKKSVMPFILSIILLISLTIISCGKDEKAPDSPATEEIIDTSAPTEATTPAPTEPPTTTEAPVINYEIVKRFTFDDPDSIGWKATNQIKDFRVEDGLLKLTSSGGDPFFTASAKLDIAAEEIDVIRIRAKNMSESDKCQLFFSTDIESDLSESKSYKDFYWYSESDPDSDEWNEVLIYTDDCDLWEGVIKTLRFDPLEGEGDIFIEYISFEKIIKD